MLAIAFVALVGLAHIVAGGGEQDIPVDRDFRIGFLEIPGRRARPISLLNSKDHNVRSLEVGRRRRGNRTEAAGCASDTASSGS